VVATERPGRQGRGPTGRWPAGPGRPSSPASRRGGQRSVREGPELIDRTTRRRDDGDDNGVE